MLPVERRSGTGAATVESPLSETTRRAVKEKIAAKFSPKMREALEMFHYLWYS